MVIQANKKRINVLLVRAMRHHLRPLCYLTTFDRRSPMTLLSAAVLSSAILISGSSPTAGGNSSASSTSQSIFGFRDAAAESAVEKRLVTAPDPTCAEEHLRNLTQVPHMADTPEAKATADYVAQKFRVSGLDTEIVEYKVLINYPSAMCVDLTLV